MPTVKLASQRMPSGISMGRANSVLFSSQAGSIRAPQISASAGRVNYKPMPVPDIQKTTMTAFLEGGATFANAATKAAFDYHLRESKVYADAAVIAFKDETRRALNGYEDEEGNFNPGYLNAEGMVASETHGQFQDRINNAYSDALAGLEPRARQMAMIQLSAERDTVLGRGAVHRSTQLQAAEEQMRYENVKSITRDIATNPGSIYQADKLTGINNKQRFYSQFTDTEDADKAWYETVQEVGEKLYLEQDLEAATAFYKDIGQYELAASPEHSNEMLGNVRKWEYESIRAANSSAELELKMLKRQKQETWDRTEAMLTSMRLRGEMMSKDTLAAMVDGQLVDPQVAKVYNQDVYGERDQLADPEVFRQWIDNLTRTASNGFVDDDGTVLSMEHQKDDRLDTSARSFLLRLEQDLTNPEYQNRYKRGKEFIDTWLKGEIWEQGLFDQQNESLINSANRELHSRLSGGQDFDEIIDDMARRYDRVIVDYDKLPQLRSGVKPRDLEQLNDEMKKVDARQAAGQLSAQEYNEQYALMIMYERSIMAMLAAAAESGGEAR